MGSFNSADKLLLRRWPYSRCCEGGYNLADSERRGKACGYENEARKGAKNAKILYVEDDLSLIDGLQYTLEASGYMVDNAKTVKEALALFRKNTYDLLLLDVTLPDGTGFDVCKAVRNSSTVPIIF